MDRRARRMTLSNLERRRRSYVHFLLDREPKSKKASRDEQKALQKFFQIEMNRLGKTSFSKDIAIEIDVQSTKKTPPQIEKFVKNIIDVMHKKEYLDNLDDAARLPFIDDKQIKYLRAGTYPHQRCHC